MSYRTVIELEQDDFAGWHAVVSDAEDNAVLHVSNSYSAPEDAERAAQSWIDTHDRKEPHMNTPEPRYAAYVGGTIVEVGDNLTELIDTISADMRGCEEDVIIWNSGRTVAALLQADGSVLILEGEQAGRRRKIESTLNVVNPKPSEDPIVALLERVFWPRSGRRK